MLGTEVTMAEGRLVEIAVRLEARELSVLAAEFRRLQEVLAPVQAPPSPRGPTSHVRVKEIEREVFAELRSLWHDLDRHGLTELANQVERLIGVLEFEAGVRDEAWLQRELLVQWDRDDSGALEEPEVAAYRDQVASLRHLAERDAYIPVWYFMTEATVHGPAPLSQVTGQLIPPPWLVRHTDELGWVRVSDLFEDRSEDVTAL